MNDKTGGSAFPGDGTNVFDGSHFFQPGMTLRDYFAGCAFVSMGRLSVYDTNEKDIAYAAYQYADAMIAERNKEAGR